MVKIPKNIFFTPKISILMKFFVLVVTKTRHPEQTSSPKNVTRNKPRHQNSSPGTNLVTKYRHQEQTLSPNFVTRNKPCHQTLLSKNIKVKTGQERSGKARKAQERPGKVRKSQERRPPDASRHLPDTSGQLPDTSR